MYTFSLIPGDGIGPEVTQAAVQVIEAAGITACWNRVVLDPAKLQDREELIPAEVLDVLRSSQATLKGPITTPIGSGFRSVTVALRRALGLYANVRPVRTMPGVPSRYSDVKIDLVIVRENTEDLYVSIERQVDPDRVEAIKLITRHASTRIVEYACQYAKDNGYRQVTAVHKSNVLRLSDGLFLEVARTVKAQYPTLTYTEMIVDNAAMQLVIRPEQFQVMVMPNLYGDILSDLAAGLIGGLGLAPSANIGTHGALFEPVHGSAPDIAGQGKANPIACILSAAMMLDYVGARDASKRIRRAVDSVLAGHEIRTVDLGGRNSTADMTAAIIAAL